MKWFQFTYSLLLLSAFVFCFGLNQTAHAQQRGKPKVYVVDGAGLLNEVTPDAPMDAIVNTYPRISTNFVWVNFQQTGITFRETSPSTPDWSVTFSATNDQGSTFGGLNQVVAGYCKFFGQNNAANVRWTNGMNCNCPDRINTTAQAGVFKWGTKLSYDPVPLARHETCAVTFSGSAPIYGIIDDVRYAYANGKYTYNGKGENVALPFMPDVALVLPPDTCPSGKTINYSGTLCINPDTAAANAPVTGPQYTPLPGATNSTPSAEPLVATCEGFFKVICEIIQPVKTWLLGTDTQLQNGVAAAKDASTVTLPVQTVYANSQHFGQMFSWDPLSRFGTGACPPEVKWSSFGGEVSIPLSDACQVFAWMGGVFKFLSGVIAVRIAAGGGS